MKFRFVKTSENQMPLFFFKITQTHKKGMISLTCLNLPFSDWGRFISEFAILKSTMGYQVSRHGTSVIQHTRLFSHRNWLSSIDSCLSESCLHLILYQKMPNDKYTISASFCYEMESILDHKPCSASAFL